MFRDNITEVARTVIGTRKRLNKPWLSAEADRLIELKRDAVNRGDNAKRNRLKKAFNARAQEDRERYYNDIAKEAEAALQRSNMKPIYRAVKRISDKESSGDGTFPRKLDGTLCKSEEEALL